MIAIMLVAVTVLPLSAHPPAPSQPPFSEDNEGSQLAPAYVPGEILVKFKPAVDPVGAQTTLAAQDLQVTGAIQSIDVLKVTVEPGQELETIATLQREPSVLYAEPNYIAFAFDTIPNDPLYGKQWGLPKINGPAAWDITTGSSDVIIAVVDTGIDLDHPDLSCPGKLMTGKNFVSPGLPPDDDHDHGHGTHVAGIASACTNNANGVAGVAWGARLLPVKVLKSDGFGTYDWLASGITYAVDNGADVINVSAGGAGNSSTLSDAVQYANNRGRLVVAATGNSYGPVYYPAAFPEAMAVAATDSFDQRLGFSNYGPETDIAAPGGSIYSTLIGGYGSLSGTSMATPHVAGLAALIWSLKPDLPHDQVRNIIQATAVDLGTPGKDDFFGHGRVDAGRALDTLVNLQTSPSEVSFLVDDSGSVPSSATVQVTTASTDPLTWTTTISPSVTWLEVVPPLSGTVSAASPDSFTLVVSAPPSTHGSFDTAVIVVGTTSSGRIVGWAATEVRLTYIPHLYQIRLPSIFKNTRID